MKYSQSIFIHPGLPELILHEWQPEKTVKAVILLVHGLGEHAGRYGGDFADFYTDSGFVILAPDLPGHGKTPGPRGHIADTNQFLDYLDALIAKLRAAFPGKPLFLYGHSLGGGIVLWHTLARQPQVNGVIVTSPVIGTRIPVPAFKVWLASVMNSLFPAFSMDNGLDAQQLSRDKNIVRAYINDPLVHRLVSARLGKLILEFAAIIPSQAHKNQANILLMVGSEEGIVDKNAIQTFSNITPRVEYKEWPGLYHEIHNEPEKETVFIFTIAWMEKLF